MMANYGVGALGGVVLIDPETGLPYRAEGGGGGAVPPARFKNSDLDLIVFYGDTEDPYVSFKFDGYLGEPLGMGTVGATYALPDIFEDEMIIQSGMISPALIVIEATAHPLYIEYTLIFGDTTSAGIAGKNIIILINSIRFPDDESINPEDLVNNSCTFGA